MNGLPFIPIIPIAVFLVVLCIVFLINRKAAATYRLEYRMDAQEGLLEVSAFFFGARFKRKIRYETIAQITEVDSSRDVLRNGCFFAEKLASPKMAGSVLVKSRLPGYGWFFTPPQRDAFITELRRSVDEWKSSRPFGCEPGFFALLCKTPQFLLILLAIAGAVFGVYLGATMPHGKAPISHCSK
jgi:hypothetical protein